MPTLNWIGKEAVVNHDKEVPFRLLKKVKSYSVGENSQNLIIKGDNLEGLKALMPYYIGKVKCIYIDPPYNTGNENWVYNDKVNSPKIKKWLGKVVGGEAQDLCRHDKWLCMMYPRLKLLRDLLSEDGVIFVSIDDNEQAHLKLLMDEVFGSENFVVEITREAIKGGSQSKLIRKTHDYVSVYAKNIDLINFSGIEQEGVKLNLEDEKGPYAIGRELNKWGAGSRREDAPGMHFPVPGPNGEEVYPIRNDGSEGRWRLGKKNMLKKVKDGDVIFKKRENGTYIVYEKLRDNSPKIKQFISIFKDNYINAKGSEELKKLFGTQRAIFDYSKPVELVLDLMRMADLDKDSIILDSFAGSGTTGHAVLDMNKEDGGNRKFILIEMEDDIAKKITAERIKRAIEKYDYKDGFEYCELDKPLFDENGQIEETCDFNQFATYIYFTETQTNIDKKQIDKNFIGETGENEYYLIYKEKYKNVLDKKFLSKIKKTKYKKIIYADFCMIDEDTLKLHNIQFKQIPYEVKVY
ncbi:site-specific DNA-methyltransferase [Candidatus Pacearchaeota archaeon]|nr:site-specific DNA-methyltransferase [Candidatus Pacearchaeota archaeon]